MSRPGGPHRQHRTPKQQRGLLTAAVAAAICGSLLLGLRFVPGSPLAASASSDEWPASTAGNTSAGSESPSPSPSPSLPPLAVSPGPVSVDTTEFLAWAMIDLRTGEVSGSKNMSSTSTTASLIKAWIAADYLRRIDEKGQTPTDARLDEVSIMIRDSDNDAASDLYKVVGEQASTKRLIKICELTDSSPGPTSWSDTKLSARDTARMGACIADGRAAGPEWTDWLLKEMRSVRGVGDFGIRKAFPDKVAKTIAIKNGWVVRDYDGNWHINCLAIGDEWTMGVMMRFDASLGFEYGAAICKSIATQLRSE